MKTKMHVIAVGGPVPQEGKPQKLITKDESVEVDASDYYTRRILFGELKEAAAHAHKEPKKGKE